MRRVSVRRSCVALSLLLLVFTASLDNHVTWPSLCYLPFEMPLFSAAEQTSTPPCPFRKDLSDVIRSKSLLNLCRRAVLTAVATGLVASAGHQPALAQSSVEFVQVAYATPQTPQATVSATYAAAQTAGNLNVLLVGWNDTTAQVQTVSDARGNTYVRAIGPTVDPG